MVRTSSSTGGSGSSWTWRIPKPPPTSIVRGVQSSSSRQRSANCASSATASRCARTSASWEPTWTCSPSTSSPASRAARTASTRFVLVEPELGAAVAGADRLVRLRLDPGRDADEDAAHACRGRARRLVERVQRRRAPPPRPRRAAPRPTCCSRARAGARPRSPPAARRRARPASRRPRRAPPRRAGASAATFGNAFVP